VPASLLAIAIPTPAYARWRYKQRPVPSINSGHRLSCVEGPAWLWPLCYPYRWLDMLHDGLSTLWKIASSRIATGKSQEEHTDIRH